MHMCACTRYVHMCMRACTHISYCACTKRVHICAYVHVHVDVQDVHMCMCIYVYVSQSSPRCLCLSPLIADIRACKAKAKLVSGSTENGQTRQFFDLYTIRIKDIII